MRAGFGICGHLLRLRVFQHLNAMLDSAIKAIRLRQRGAMLRADRAIFCERRERAARGRVA